MKTIIQILLAALLFAVVASAKATCWHCDIDLSHDHDEYALEDHGHTDLNNVTNISNYGVDQASVEGMIKGLKNSLAAVAAAGQIPALPPSKKFGFGAALSGSEDALGGAIGVKGRHKDSLMIDATISAAEGSSPYFFIGGLWGW